MAYSELIKNFAHIRDYMREFYVYGLKSRDEYTGKSARSYDDERRRVESWMGDTMRCRREADGKRVFLAIDSRLTRHNPLYRAWRSKSFTDGDITLHFLLFDLLDKPETALSLPELMQGVDALQAGFATARVFDESTIRKKLKEYVREGLIEAEKSGRRTVYRRAKMPDPAQFVNPEMADLLDFYAEAAPCGVVGAYLLDRLPPHTSHFAFKHHYITGAMDSEVVCALLEAMQEQRTVTLKHFSRFHARAGEHTVAPLRLMISAQNGRQYLMAYVLREQRISAFRTDYIQAVQPGEPCADFAALRARLDAMQPHLWGVSTQGPARQPLEHLDFTVRYAPDEEHIPRRLEREKRCGTVENIAPGVCRYTADVFDAGELIPWVRTFLCRITAFHCSNPVVERRFRQDLKKMYRLYGLAEQPAQSAPAAAKENAENAMKENAKEGGR